MLRLRLPLARAPAVALALCFAAGAATAAPLPPSFQASNVAVGPGPHSVVTGDWNEDGALDFATANREGGGGGSVSVRLATGGNRFLVHRLYSIALDPYDLAAADLDEDGHLDLAAACLTGRKVSLLFGDGAGNFGSAVQLENDGGPIGIRIRDLDQDGHADLVTADYRGNSASVFLGAGDGTFGGRIVLPAGGQPWAVDVGDLNGDGRPDIVTANEASGTASVFLNMGAGSFMTRVHYIAGGLLPRSVTIGDLDLDTHLDLAVQLGDGTTSILFNRGDGTFLAPVLHGPGGGFAFACRITDINADGDPDVLAADAGVNGVLVLLGTGGGAFVRSASLSSLGGPRGLAIADFTGDGLPEVLSANEVANSVRIFFNQTSVPVEPTSIVMEADSGASVYGHPVRLTAHVTPGTARGTVRFEDEGAVLGSAPVVAGAATLDLLGLVSGTHPLRAVFLPEAGFGPSASEVVPFDVALAGTATQLLLPPSPVGVGLPVRLVVVVRTTTGGRVIPHGAVRFAIDGVARAETTPLVDGVAVDSAVGLAIGTHEIGAEYLPPDPMRFTGSAAVPRTIEVAPAGPGSAGGAEGTNGPGGRRAEALALGGAFPNPADSRRPVLRLKLSTLEPARLEVLDLAGRRVWVESLGALAPGEHALRLSPPRPLAPGVYLLRLVQGDSERRGRFVVAD